LVFKVYLSDSYWAIKICVLIHLT